MNLNTTQGDYNTEVLNTLFNQKDKTYRIPYIDEILNTKANTEDLATVATSGSYNDLSDTPDLSTKQDTISDLDTIREGAAKGATALQEHQSLAEYAKLVNIPTKASDLLNDVGYLTEHQSLEDYALKTDIPVIPTLVSTFTNDAGYLTEHQDISGKQDTLTAGTNIKIENNVVSAVLEGFSPYTEGANITIKDSVISAIVPTKNSALENDSDFATVAYVDGQIALINPLKLLPVDTLPTEDIDENTIYLLKHVNEDGTEIRIEYLYRNGSWDPIGTNETVLVGYAKIEDVPTKVSELENDSNYLTSYTETDPVFTASVAANITDTDILNWNGKAKVYSGTSEPQQDFGVDGDIYIQLEG